MRECSYIEDIFLEYFFPANLNFWCGTNINIAEWQERLKDPMERKRMKEIMDKFDWSPLGDPDWMEE